LIFVAPNDLPRLPPRFSKRSLGKLVRNRIVDCVSNEIRLTDLAIESQRFLTTLVLSIGVRSGVGNCNQITPIQRRPRFPESSIVLHTPRELAIGIVLCGGAPVVMSSLYTQEL
jgi:hypothetical protein